MEKQGMDRGRQFLRAGLLIFFACNFLIPAGFSFAQAEGGTEQGESPETSGLLEIKVETSPASPAVNSPWAIAILVNHPSPQEVNVKPPRFPPVLVLERVRTETRFIGERWTRVEFLLTPLRAGVVSLDPFEITVKEKQAVTERINVRIREEAVKRSYVPRFSWLGKASSVPIGGKAELLLELSNWDPSKAVPQGVFQGRAPLNAIIEEAPPNEAEGGTFHYTVSVIPLEGSSVELDTFLLRSDPYTITVPAISIPVLPAVSGELPARAYFLEQSHETVNAADIAPAGKISFPENREKKTPFFAGEYRRICARVQTLWDEGLYAEALAEIRRNERDSLTGPSLVSLRRDMEQALGLGFTEDERWFPLRVSILSWAIAGLLILVTAAVLFVFRPGLRRKEIARKNVTIRRRSGFMKVIGLVFLLGFAFIFLGEGLGNFPIGRPGSPGRTAVLRETEAYRVPDFKGAVNARFNEGQPVIVGDYSLDWYNAESPDGRSGWVHREALIIY